ncbi:hypothetical protein COCVIDRAFT_20288 [Bipolaris victoriae FI3]|uniref:Uncharacterized protein n=1 Tax=Bipolaris victoriae (strain FI3) TaxID=930091 RepID=W7E0C4_BIPV3|nr:hypothetical protein COCVIDRAFT_20288 [Bipolaris victoriae FI3]
MPSKCVPEIPMRSVENTVTDLHNASLISNDVEDDSDLCGRQIATYLVFEHEQTIDSTKFMLSTMVYPSIAEYLHMAACRRDGLFHMRLQLAKPESTSAKDEVLGIPWLSPRPNQKLLEHAKEQIFDLTHASGVIDATRSYLWALEDRIDDEIKKLEIASGDSNHMLHLLIERLSGDWSLDLNAMSHL